MSEKEYKSIIKKSGDDPNAIQTIPKWRVIKRFIATKNYVKASANSLIYKNKIIINKVKLKYKLKQLEMFKDFPSITYNKAKKEEKVNALKAKIDNEERILNEEIATDQIGFGRAIGKKEYQDYSLNNNLEIENNSEDIELDSLDDAKEIYEEEQQEKNDTNIQIDEAVKKAENKQNELNEKINNQFKELYQKLVMEYGEEYVNAHWNEILYNSINNVAFAKKNSDSNELNEMMKEENNENIQNRSL